MLLFLRRLLVASLCLAPSAAAAAPPLPKLIVAISVDQYGAALFDRYRESYTGGLRRMADGLTFTGYQSHAATETCPGHSTLLTGMHPSHTGIAANTWFDPRNGSSVYCVSVAGVADPLARGPQNLRVDTLGDWLKHAQPGARVVAVSGKDRAAITMGGHHADAVYWWVDGQGFSTSRYGEPATPAVLAPAQAFDRALFARWRAHPPVLWPEPSAACAALAKPHQFGRVRISGAVPPDGTAETETGPDFLARTDFGDQLRASTAFDPLVLDFAWDLVTRDGLGRGPKTDLLAVSLSATDYVGHRYGNGGAEMCTQTHAVDQALGAFFAHLDSLHVPYLVMLTADHGAMDAAERAAETGLPATRIDDVALVAALNAHLRTAVGLTYDPIVGDDPQQLTVNVADPAMGGRVRDLAVAWLKTRPEVSGVFTADEVRAATPAPGTPPDTLSLVQRYAESDVPGRSGDIAVAYREYATLGMPRGTGDVVAGHGTPWDYDRRVPILWWWPGITPERRAEPIETVDIAPTLASIAQVPAPPVDGHCLAQVTTCPVASAAGTP